MIDIYVLNKNLEAIGIIDAYRSLIWSERYVEIGDCELYLPADAYNIDLLKKDRYLYRDSDHMVCRIDYVEITTDSEEGNYLIVKGSDTKKLCDQRVITKTMFCKGSVETFLRKMITDTIISPSDSARKMKKSNGNDLVALATATGLTEKMDCQATWDNVGEKIREICETYGFGYRFRLSSDILQASIIKGTDRRNSVIFSDAYENLSSTDYIDDKTNMGNTAVVGGEGQGSKRTVVTLGTYSGTDRYEIFQDSDAISRSVTYQDLTGTYTGGTVVSSSGSYYYQVPSLDAPTYDSNHLAWLQTNYPGGSLVTVDGQEYWRITNVNIASVESASPDNNSTATLLDIIYLSSLLSSGADARSEYGEEIIFEGKVIPDITFIYGTDYYLGDIVTVENEYGIQNPARITEVIEVLDENGYSVEPTFKFTEVS